MIEKKTQRPLLNKETENEAEERLRKEDQLKTRKSNVVKLLRNEDIVDEICICGHLKSEHTQFSYQETPSMILRRQIAPGIYRGCIMQKGMDDVLKATATSSNLRGTVLF